MGVILYFVSVLFLMKEAQCQDENLLDLATTLGLTRLVQEITEKGLDGILTEPGPITLMGPTDDAFSRVPGYLESNDTAMVDILTFHVHRGYVESADITDELTVATEINGGYSFRFNIYGGVNTSHGAPVSSPDNLATNGILHVIDEVMMPGRQNLLELTGSTDFLSVLYQGLVDTGITAELETDPITGIGPDNQAFYTMDPPVTDLDVLREVLRYHLIADTLYAAGLQDGQTYTTLQGSVVTVSINGSGDIFVNDAYAYINDVTTTNGAAHVLDKVLIPPSSNIIEELEKDVRFKTLVSVLGSDPRNMLAGEGHFTIFAPTDAAFEKFDNFGLMDAKQKSGFLKHHIVEKRLYTVGLHAGQKIQSMEAGQYIYVSEHNGEVVLNTGAIEGIHLKEKDITATNGVIHVIDDFLIPKAL